MHCRKSFFSPGLLNSCLLALGLELIVVTAGRAEAPPSFAFSINSAQVPGGLSPRGVATDPSGKIYISSLWNLVKVEPNGSYMNRWGTQGDGAGQFSYAGQSGVDKQGHVFVLDGYNDRVEEYDTNGNFIVAWGSHGTGPGEFDGADGLAVSNDGLIYVSDANNFRIQIFSGLGLFLKRFGSIGTNNGQFSFPGPIAIDSSNNVYVLDAPGGDFDNFRVQKFDSSGQFRSQWSSHGMNEAGFIELGGIATDSSNNLYVADGANNRIQKFSGDGEFLSEWGSLGNGPGQFNDPGGIAVDPRGNYIYVSDYYNARINVFAYAGLAPLIFQQPTNQIVPAGATARLEVGAFGAQPLTYQWQFDGTNVPAGTESELVLSNVSLATSGSYSVSVSNSLGAAASVSAILLVVPVVVTTLPVSGISVTGAVLQGSVVVGSNPSLAWFEWGAGTNYGNITGSTNLNPNTAYHLNTAVGGLDGNVVYHYRMAGSNGLGVVYGEDMAFQVGAKPVVVTLPVIAVSTNGVLLSASVNPQARDTRVYFQWGHQGFGSSTFTNELASGTTAVTVQDQISNLVPGVTYFVKAIAINDLGLVSGTPVSFIAPPAALLPVPQQRVWSALATSADGQTLAAVAGDNRVYLSRDSGMTWTSNPAPSLTSKAIAISGDAGRILLGAGNLAYVSTNLGVTWAKSTLLERGLHSMSSSGDGLNVAAIQSSGQSVLTSADGGITWATNSPPPLLASWSAIASSANGQKLIAAAGGSQGSVYGAVFTSVDAGHSWTSNNLPLSFWQSVGSSADGQTLLAAGGGQHSGPIYYSTNGGNSWSQTTAPSTNWQKVAVSADGRTFAALARLESNQLITSTNSGLTWDSLRLPPAIWSDLVLSADGAKLFAAGDQMIVSLQNRLAPFVNAKIYGNHVSLSWTIPSATFLLQQRRNLASDDWTSTTATPTLMLTNLEYQLFLPATSPASFFRLESFDSQP